MTGHTYRNVRILDLGPRLRAKRSKDCKHEYCSVDLKAASLTCNACDSEIDPWWWIRREATQAEAVIADANRIADAKAKECNEVIARTNETLRCLNAEVETLSATRNRLANEEVNGQRVGSVRRRRKPC